ncbi:CoA-binding protein [Mucilaginibacter sp.]|uniref:CoA-binding protein n=1 Tax=Mucilaginibacter sp. TaxID=1882438 RepID=UPI00262D0410|nr:CoA-binding protein [Mucilaginibacter sp.]MDB4918982.1 hypothetical protein [Mucilaginibacter sp.]
MTENYTQILKNARTILLVDWPGADVPLSLLKAGFTIVSYAPDSYSMASFETNYEGKEKFVFKNLDELQGEIDIVNIFRPEEEHSEIISRHVLPLKAKAGWLQPTVTSANTAALASLHGLMFIEGIDIASVAKSL